MDNIIKQSRGNFFETNLNKIQIDRDKLSTGDGYLKTTDENRIYFYYIDSPEGFFLGTITITPNALSKYLIIDNTNYSDSLTFTNNIKIDTEKVLNSIKIVILESKINFKSQLFLLNSLVDRKTDNWVTISNVTKDSNIMITARVELVSKELKKLINEIQDK